MASQEYLSCIYCGRSKPVQTIRKNLEGFNSFDISWKILQVREVHPGPGRGITKAKLKERGQDHGGFTVIREQSLSVIDMAKDPEYSDLLEGIRSRLIMITKAYIQAGIIKKEELE